CTCVEGSANRNVRFEVAAGGPQYLSLAPRGRYSPCFHSAPAAGSTVYGPLDWAIIGSGRVRSGDSQPSFQNSAAFLILSTSFSLSAVTSSSGVTPDCSAARCEGKAPPTRSS